jgi:hypothetical protein
LDSGVGMPVVRFFPFLVHKHFEHINFALAMPLTLKETLFQFD